MASRRTRLRRSTPPVHGLPPEYPHKIACPMASRDIDAPNVRERGDVAVPLCSGFGSPWNNYVSVSLPRNIAPGRGPRSTLCLVDTGDSDVMILPWWGGGVISDCRLRKNSSTISCQVSCHIQWLFS